MDGYKQRIADQLLAEKGGAGAAGGGGSRIMQRSKNTRRWQNVRKMAWDRDRKARARCHICGGYINYSIPPSSAPYAWEPDHIRSYKIAPELELDLCNIAPSHRECNRRRGSGTHDNDLGQRTRIW